MTLQEAFYVLGIVVMSFSILFLIVIVGAVLVIRNKISHIHKVVEDKLSFAKTASKVAKKVIKKK